MVVASHLTTTSVRMRPGAKFTGLLLRGLGFRVKLLYYPPIMENQMEKKMENEMETGGIWGFKELRLSY